MTTPEAPPSTSHTAAEVASQPDVWARVLDLPAAQVAALPRPGERVLALGCGTSYHVLDAYARRRQHLGLGVTRAAVASELDEQGGYDVVVALSRSGTTSDLLRALSVVRPAARTVAVTGTPGSPIIEAVDEHVLLDFADERSVVQTRFATASLTLLRRSVDDPVVDRLVPAARGLLAAPPAIDPDAHDHFVFLGTGWTTGLASEAALKLCESALLRTDAYPVLEYRHGPIACAGPRTLVWSLCPVPDDLADAIRATGARLRVTERDPQVELVEMHRTGLAYARRRGVPSDTPPHLSRAVTD